MSNDAEHATSLSPRELDELLSTAWETAARLNPMCLMKLHPDLAFQNLRGMINDCLARGMSSKEMTAHIVQELLGSSSAPTTSLSSGSRGQQDKQVSS
jgi:hypothetical protein